MKVKILILPLALVIALSLMVWLVYPSYLDMQIKKKALDDKNIQVSDLDQKNQKVKDLMGTLNANADKQVVVMKFLPESQKEEEIIASLNELASGEGVSVSGISISKPKIEVLPLEVVAMENQPSETSAGLVSPSREKVINFDTNLSLYGNYEKIKNVIDKVYNLSRFNRITNLKISSSTIANKDGSASDNLQADMILGFNYLEMEKIGSVADVNNKILSSGRFDMSIVDEIQKNKNTPVSLVNLDSLGKANPFLP
jgi:hypothetical protein